MKPASERKYEGHSNDQEPYKFLIGDIAIMQKGRQSPWFALSFLKYLH